MLAQLQQAITYIRNGDKEQGKRLLAEVLIQNPGQEVAWLLMAETVDYDEHRRYCLEQVLRLNPSNKFARDRLAALQRNRVSQGTPDKLARTDDPAFEGGVKAEEPAATSDVGAEFGTETPVREPAGSRGSERAQRKNPILFVVAALIVIGGLTLFFLSTPSILAFSLDPQARLLDAPDIWQYLLLMVLGAMLTIAGLVGIWWALWPSRGRPPSSRQQPTVGRRRRESRSDPRDAGLWLDTGSVDEQKTGIRLF